MLKGFCIVRSGCLVRMADTEAAKFKTTPVEACTSAVDMRDLASDV